MSVIIFERYNFGHPHTTRRTAIAAIAPHINQFEARSINQYKFIDHRSRPFQWTPQRSATWPGARAKQSPSRLVHDTSSPPADYPSKNSTNARTSFVTSHNYNRWNVWPNTYTLKLLSAAGTGYFYTARRNVTRSPEKFKMVKFDPVVRRRVLFTEHKIK